MPQRSDQRSGDDGGVSDSSLTDSATAEDLTSSLGSDESSPADSTGSTGVTGRVKQRATGIFAPKTFLAAVLALGAGMFAGSAVIPIPFLDNLGGLVGVFAAAFLLGLVVERSTVLESAVAGAVVAGLTTMLGHLALAALGAGVPLAVFGAGTGLVAGGLGAYFGGDLRDGLTRDI